MRRKVLLIYNPRAGRGQFLSALPQVIDDFTKAGYSVEVYPTQAAGDAKNRMTDLDEEYEMIIPAGGDGTLDEVVTGYMKTGCKVPIGYIPVGSTNDFASSLGLSTSIPNAVADILEGTPCGIDAGIFNEEHIFVYVAAFGAFTDVAYATNQDLKNIFGHAAYVIEAVKRLADLTPYEVHVRAGDFEAEGDYVFGMITNSTSVGGIKNITGTEILLDDGLFEVTLVRNPRNIIEMQEIVGCLITQNHDSELIDYFKADHIELTAGKAFPWTFDGEDGGEWKRIVIENRCKAIPLIVNKKKRTETPLQ